MTSIDEPYAGDATAIGEPGRRDDDLGASLPAQSLARLLLSGEVGLTLFNRLLDHFPEIRRTDAFLGVALAWTDLQAALLAAEAQIIDLRRRLAGRDAP
jgi:hypothetical protein